MSAFGFMARQIYTSGAIVPLTVAAMLWDAERWPNFTAQELACTCKACGGQIFYDPAFFDRLQAVRRAVGPLRINSGHRCGLHNARVGGAVRSSHLKMAADIHIGGYDRHALHSAATHAGFSGFGFYQTFLHVDTGRARHWFGGDRSKALWS